MPDEPCKPAVRQDRLYCFLKAVKERMWSREASESQALIAAHSLYTCSVTGGGERVKQHQTL